MNLIEHLHKYIQEPYSDVNNFNLALCYFNIGQTAPALSFFLRTAEFSINNDLVYESLIMTARCLSIQNRTNNSELGVYNQAVRFNPTRPEAYYFLSLYHEKVGNWLESNINACLSELFSINKKPTFIDIGYREYSAKFQKAVSYWWIGQANLSEELFYELADEYGYKLSDSYKKNVLTNINFLKMYRHKHLIYDYTQFNNLKFKFKGSESIKRNYSQAMQDMFILTVLDGKRDGSYVEIGAGDAFYGSNTALLDTEFGWSGVSVEYNKNYMESFNNRNSKYISDDAREIDYDKVFKEMGFKEIDYLQLDCDPPNVTYEVLLKIPFDKYKFAVITYEHDEYTNPDKNYKELSRVYLKGLGYQLVVDNVAPDRLCSFEDWWVHPDLVDENIIRDFKVISNKPKKPTDFML